MTEFYIEKRTLPTASWRLSSLPSLAFQIEFEQVKSDFLLDEDDGLFINYGRRKTVFPYRYQDDYSRELSDAVYDTVVLENEFLKAVFMPCFGGKLWSLFDKAAGRELLFENTVARPSNLACRKAWFSGGVEWNAGIKGHSPYTAELLHTARTELDDGTPVLRFYYLERIRRAVVQMDFFLPAGAKTLYARMRLTNPNAETIPMYWWSNIAVTEKEGDRVVAPADEAYTTLYSSGVIKTAMPMLGGVDVSYPKNNTDAIDYFWNTSESGRKYIFQADKDGYGLFQTSTSRLQGRKLFVWGNSQGGKRWAGFLTADGESGAYDEIQCGLARTQYESLPMPPHTVWEWLEAYGALQTDKNKVHGAWATAKAETEEKISEILSQEALEKLLKDTRAMAKRGAKLLYRGDGWGALEKKAAPDIETSMFGHLDFGDVAEEQFDWLRLFEKGTLGTHSPDEIPVSYCIGTHWRKKLEEAVENKDRENWYTWYQLGVLAAAEERFGEAERLLKASYALSPSPWAEYALAVVYRKTGNRAAETELILSAYGKRKTDISLAKEALLTLHETENAEEAKKLYESAESEVRDNKRCLFYYAFALARLQETERAEAILLGTPPLIVPDLREGEVGTVELWNLIRKNKGLPPAEPPEELDFRMFAGREKKQEKAKA